MIQFQFHVRDSNKISINKYAFYKSVCIHILANQSTSKIPSSIFLYLHHFSIALLEWQNRQPTTPYFTKPMTSLHAKEIQEIHIGIQSLHYYNNSVTFNHNTSIATNIPTSRTKLTSPKYRQQYVKSPLLLPTEVEMFLKIKRKSSRTNSTDLCHTQVLIQDQWFMKYIKGRHDGKIKGHLIMDKVKLKNRIMWYCMNGTVIGFIVDELNAKDSMLDILGLSNTKKDDNRQFLAYTNQWTFRSTRGVVHNFFLF